MWCEGKGVFKSELVQTVANKGPRFKGGGCMACPICNSGEFLVKDPDNSFDFWEFDVSNGRISFDDEDAADEAPEMTDDREVYCRRCSWHGKIETIK
jgi:hypothetical protein